MLRFNLILCLMLHATCTDHSCYASGLVGLVQGLDATLHAHLAFHATFQGLARVQMLGFNVFLHFFAALKLHPVFDALLPVPVSLSLGATLKYGVRWFRWFKVSLSVGSKFIEGALPQTTNQTMAFSAASENFLPHAQRVFSWCTVEMVTNHCKKKCQVMPYPTSENFAKKPQ